MTNGLAAGLDLPPSAIISFPPQEDVNMGQGAKKEIPANAWNEHVAETNAHLQSLVIAAVVSCLFHLC